MWRKFRLLLLAAALVSFGANSGGFGGVVGWFALSYVLWRAAPSVIRDIRHVWSGVGSISLWRRRPANTEL